MAGCSLYKIIVQLESEGTVRVLGPSSLFLGGTHSDISEQRETVLHTAPLAVQTLNS